MWAKYYYFDIDTNPAFFNYPSPLTYFRYEKNTAAPGKDSSFPPPSPKVSDTHLTLIIIPYFVISG
jgi:hypothetical protein